MTRTKTVFFCTDCGNETPRWQGQCPACEGWNTLVEEQVSRRKAGTRRDAGDNAGPRARAEVVRLADVGESDVDRWSSGIPDFDFVLGGGVVPGSVILIGGEPGIGKSTLLLQAAGRLQERNRSVLYVTGEESAAQVKMRSDRLEEPTGDIRIFPETELGPILDRARNDLPDLLLIDSIQTIFSADVDGVPGSISQVRECAARFQRFAKEQGVTVVLVGHVTKGGGLAGPKTLEHIVDTVLHFENTGGVDHRLIRATKNRFGSVDEIAVFRMSARGLSPVANPSELFLGDRDGARAGCAVTAIVEGSRPLLVEIQALATPAPYGAPQRVAAGFDHKRLALLLAVLERRAGMAFGQSDVFLNIVGGLKINEPGVDAAVVTALVSAVRDQPIAADTVVVGEIGLGGEIRSVPHLDRRLGEVARMGFRTAVVPGDAGKRPLDADIEVRSVSSIQQLLAGAFD